MGSKRAGCLREYEPGQFGKSLVAEDNDKRDLGSRCKETMISAVEKII
jgi:hypothetical protein